LNDNLKLQTPQQEKLPTTDSESKAATDGGTTDSQSSQQSVISAGENPECPECNALSLYYSEGCKTCESCGWSEC
jgi:ribonucleoside-diphosphate reductase alpha chain